MADPKGFMNHSREVAGRRPVTERVGDWNEVYPNGVGRALLPIIKTQASRCMDGGMTFCQQGCPLGWCDRAAARHQQLPGVHRAAVPSSVRDRLCLGDQPRPGDHQERRSLDH